MVGDPRHFQIAMLGGLLAYGQGSLGFGVSGVGIGATLLAALLTQGVLSRVVDARSFEPRSALISGLSLCLLLRSEALWLVPAAAGVAIASKFVLRRQGRHVFNPTAFAIVATLLGAELGALPAAWVSPGQWGSSATGVFVWAGLGSLVVYRAERSDVTWAFVAAYAAIVLGRSQWLGDPLAIGLHQLQGGALWIFAFFMISDPRTTPASRTGRCAFAVLVAVVACWLRFVHWEPHALFYALVASAPLVPLFDRWLPGPRHEWPAGADVESASALASGTPPTGDSHEPASPRLHPGRSAVWGGAR